MAKKTTPNIAVNALLARIQHQDLALSQAEAEHALKNLGYIPSATETVFYTPETHGDENSPQQEVSLETVVREVGEFLLSNFPENYQGDPAEPTRDLVDEKEAADRLNAKLQGQRQEREDLRTVLAAKLQYSDLTEAEEAFGKYLVTLESQFPDLSYTGKGTVEEKKQYVDSLFDKPVKYKGAKAIDHFAKSLELLLDVAGQTITGRFADAAPTLYEILSSDRVDRFVVEGVQRVEAYKTLPARTAQAKKDEAWNKILRYFSGMDEAHDVLDKLMVEEYAEVQDKYVQIQGEHRRVADAFGREQKGLAEMKNAAEKLVKNLYQAENDLKEYSAKLEKAKEKSNDRSFYTFLATVAAVVIGVGQYLYFKSEQSTCPESIAQVQKLRRELVQMPRQYQAQNQAAQERADRATSQMDLLQRKYELDVNNVREQQVQATQQLAEMQARLNQTYEGRLRLNQQDPAALALDAREYIQIIGGQFIATGPGCEKALRNLHTAMGGSSETEDAFVNALKNDPLCKDVSANQLYVPFRLKP